MVPEEEKEEKQVTRGGTPLVNVCNIPSVSVQAFWEWYKATKRKVHRRCFQVRSWSVSTKVPADIPIVEARHYGRIVFTSGGWVIGSLQCIRRTEHSIFFPFLFPCLVLLRLCSTYSASLGRPRRSSLQGFTTDTQRSMYHNAA